MIIPNTITKGNIGIKSRHVEYNHKQSPDDEMMVRYYLLVADDKNREVTLDKILNQLSSVNPGLVEIDRLEGKIENSKLRYLVKIYDSLTAPSMIDWSKINKPVKQNIDLYERKSTQGLEEYLSKRFS